MKIMLCIAFGIIHGFTYSQLVLERITCGYGGTAVCSCEVLRHYIFVLLSEHTLINLTGCQNYMYVYFSALYTVIECVWKVAVHVGYDT
jgi:hypothetical protein